MQRPADIPHTDGVFAILHADTQHAYIGKAGNLRQRAAMWAHHLKANERDPAHSVRVRNWPRHPADEWAFWCVEGHDVEDVRKAFTNKGWTLINARSRTVTKYVLQGIEDTLMGHCRRLGVASWGAVYKRVSRGEPLEQALGLVDRTSALSAREHAIAQMMLKITTNDGEGHITYDEAIFMRPELGDVRERMRKYRLKNPGVTTIKLKDIPI